MSLRQHGGAALRGWDGPYHPVLIPSLATVYTERPDGEGNGSALEAAVRGIPGFVQMFRPPTARDGYDWFWAFEFTVYGGRVLVALPWAQDWQRVDGSQLDRSPAVYTQGQHVNIDTANAIVARVIRALRPGPATANPTGR